MTGIAWRPTPDVIERANVTRLMRRHGIASYRELVRRSQAEPEWFWPAVVEDLALELASPWTAVYDDSLGSEWTTWFPGARLNVAWNCVHRFARGERAGDVAAIFRGEDGGRAELTFAELSDGVTRLAEGLAALGVRAPEEDGHHRHHPGGR